MFLQTSWCLSWFHISGVHAYHQDKCSRQGTTGIFLHKAQSTISFPVSDHIIIEKFWYRTKRALSEPQHWSTWLYTTLYTRACPALSRVSVKFISVMNFWSQGLSNTVNTIHKNTITTSWSRNSHYRKGHWNITTRKSLGWDPTDTCQASVGGKNLLSCVGYAPRGNFTHTHTHHLKDHQCCEEPLQLTPLRPKFWCLTLPSLRNSAHDLHQGSTLLQSAQNCFMPPLLPSAHAWAWPSKLDTHEVNSVLPSHQLHVYQLPYQALQPALSSSLQSQVHPKHRLAVSRWAPAPQWTDLAVEEEAIGAARPCSRDGLITKVNEEVMNRNHKSLKYQKRYPLCPSN